MLTFIKRKILKIMRPVPESNYTLAVDPMHKSVGSHFRSGDNGLSFTIHNAIGGKVIQVGSYDIVSDRSRTTLYIVTDKEDLGVEIGQIITRESLSR